MDRPRTGHAHAVGEPVRRILKGRPDVVLLHLAPELLHEVGRQLYGRNATAVSLVHRLAVPDDTADRLVRLLLAEAQASGPGSSLMMGALGRALVVHLLRFHSNHASMALQHEPSRPTPRIQRVVEQMRSCLDQDLPLSQLAATAGLSPSQLVRAFGVAVGMPPHRYLQGMRIEKARELLEWTDLPVIDIALSCGFGQPGHFATTFRKAVGLSPRSWRRLRRS